MRQILQSLKSDETEITETPCPSAKHGWPLIRTRRSLVSSGTERTLVEFGKANLIEKARQQPDSCRTAKSLGRSGFGKMNFWRRGKWQHACAAAFVRVIKQGGAALIPLEELMEVSRVSIEVEEVLR